MTDQTALSVAAQAGEEPTSPARRRGTPRWWAEILLIAGFYAIYSAIRDIRGTTPVSATRALTNAQRVIGLEKTLGVFSEARLQHVVLLHARLVVEILDVWYGSTHFIITAAVLAVLYFRHPQQYRFWRNALAIATTLALVGFAFYPMLPPRLLPASYGFVDTLRTVGGLCRSTPGPWPTSLTSTPPCPASTLNGPYGVRSPVPPSSTGAGPGCCPLPTRWSCSSASSPPPTTSSLIAWLGSPST